MKKIITTLLLFVTLGVTAQDHSLYTSFSIGPYINSDFKTPQAWGYAAEVGYCYQSTVCAGISYGTLDLPNAYPYIQLRTGYTVLERKAFSLAIAGGLGYVFNAGQVIGEGDLTANVHLPNSWDFTVTFANQGVYTMGYMPAINLGFCKYFTLKPKKCIPQARRY